MVLQRSPQNNQQDNSHPLVLAVNDYADNLECLTCLLEIVGCDSMAAYHGRGAIEMAQQYQPDLILLDIMMPEMDGMEVLKRLRNNPKTRETPIIAVTGMDRNREYFLSAGFDDWLGKPIELEKLEEVIRRHI
ncbi:MAG: Signal transduction histidine-protein kinase BarA [Chroococcidiopsis cubana SAG 39.79]|nr:response regulator [Chroococcidiopsis cubana]MDZ4871087.1 Signal transduction histidine-protein kinase BarA [Chroococcidiopsis cubana SAG 39.79]PSB64102.1 response regulator [Chroococcidiopsis cubana CCALA 043]